MQSNIQCLISMMAYQTSSLNMINTPAEKSQKQRNSQVVIMHLIRHSLVVVSHITKSEIWSS